MEPEFDDDARDGDANADSESPEWEWDDELLDALCDAEEAEPEPGDFWLGDDLEGV